MKDLIVMVMRFSVVECGIEVEYFDFIYDLFLSDDEVENLGVEIVECNVGIGEFEFELIEKVGDCVVNLSEMVLNEG